MRLTETEITDEDVVLFNEVIKSLSGYDFTGYSIKSLKRRLNKILSDNTLNLKGLIDSIESDRNLLDKIVKTITVSTTELFRDPPIWLHIRKEVLPIYMNREILRIWHPGSSSGQEVYSMMILLSELHILDKSEIYASDINSDLLEQAKEGKYKYRFNQIYLENFDLVLNHESDLPGRNKKISYEKYFTIDKTHDFIQMKSFLTQKPLYRKIDLVRDENLFGKLFDIIICRNVVIYFNHELQNKVLNLFYNNLTENGCLVLGLHESIIGPYSSHFDKKNIAYFKRKV